MDEFGVEDPGEFGEFDDSGEAGGVLEIATLLPPGGVLFGVMDFEPVDDTGAAFTSPFTLQIVPIDSEEIDDLIFSLPRRVEFSA